ncbi:MAG: hypothetical protein PHO41_07705, partial [Eubacteriales bacterium]|nr:hypothetical protein [Eubacteriales bacterium]
MNLAKRFLSVFVMFALLSGVACASGDFESITQIKADAPARWTQTYETEWRTVDIDVPVQVPDVDQFPIVRITGVGPLDESLIAKYKEVVGNVPGGFSALLNGYSIGVGTDESHKSVTYFDNGEVPDLLPEDNTLTYQKALDIADTELSRLFGSVTNDLSVSETVVFSRY